MSMAPVLVVFRETQRLQPYAGALAFAEIAASALPVDQVSSIAGFSGLVLLGGTDLDPQLYGEPPHPEAQQPDRERDRCELAVLSEAISLDLPVRPSSRAARPLNVFPAGGPVKHRPAPPRPSAP